MAIVSLGTVPNSSHHDSRGVITEWLLANAIGKDKTLEIISIGIAELGNHLVATIKNRIAGASVVHIHSESETPNQGLWAKVIEASGTRCDTVVLLVSSALAYRDLRYLLYLSTVTSRNFLFVIRQLDGGPTGANSSSEDVDSDVSRALNGLHLNHKGVVLESDVRYELQIVNAGTPRSMQRQACDSFIRRAALISLNEVGTGRLCYVGTAGDPEGGEYTAYFPTFESFTVDIDATYSPACVADIVALPFRDESIDLLLCSNVIEHVAELWQLRDSISRVVRRGGHILIDSPWVYPYHAEPPSFNDYWRISTDGLLALFGNDCVPVFSEQTNCSSHVLFQRK